MAKQRRRLHVGQALAPENAAQKRIHRIAHDNRTSQQPGTGCKERRTRKDRRRAESASARQQKQSRSDQHRDQIARMSDAARTSDQEPGQKNPADSPLVMPREHADQGRGGNPGKGHVDRDRAGLRKENRRRREDGSGDKTRLAAVGTASKTIHGQACQQAEKPTRQRSRSLAALRKYIREQRMHQMRVRGIDVTLEKADSICPGVVRRQGQMRNARVPTRHGGQGRQKRKAVCNNYCRNASRFETVEVETGEP